MTADNAARIAAAKKFVRNGVEGKFGNANRKGKLAPVMGEAARDERVGG